MATRSRAWQDVAAAAHLAVPPPQARALLVRTGLWEHCWPGLVLDVSEDRGPKGVRWTVEGALRGSAEVWLEPWRASCVAHVYLRGEGGPRTASSSSTRTVGTYGERTRRLLFWAKDRLEQR